MLVEKTRDLSCRNKTLFNLKRLELFIVVEKMNEKSKKKTSVAIDFFFQQTNKKK